MFPRAAFSEMMGWHGGRDGLVEIWNGMPFFSPLWVAHRARHLAAPRARGDVADDAAAAPRRVRQLRRVEGRAADLPPHADRHAVGVEQARAGRTTSASRPIGSASSRPGIDPHYTPGGEKSPTPLVVGGRPAGAGEAVRRAHRRAGRAEAAPSRRSRRSSWARATSARSSRRRSTPPAPRRGSACPVASTKTKKVDLYRRAWVLASASAREGWGMTVTEAAACGTPAVVSDVAGHADAVVDGADRHPAADGARRAPRRSRPCSSATPTCAHGMSAARPRARGPVHVGGDRTRHARGARGRPRSRAARRRDGR